MKKLFSFLLSAVMFIGSANITLAEESDVFKNIKSKEIKDVMKNSVMLHIGSPDAFAYGKKYDLWEFGEGLEKKDDGVYIEAEFLRTVFKNIEISDEKVEIFDFAKDHNLKVNEVNGTYYIHDIGYSFPQNLNGKINSFFGIYVSPGAKGRGSYSNPTGSIQSAKGFVGALVESVGLPEGGVSVYFREGVYTVNETLTFHETDSGLPGSPITYEAYKNEKVRFNGGVSVKGSEFTAVSDLAARKKLPYPDKIVEVDLTSKLSGFYPGFKDEDPAMWTLFYNDEALSISRWPNKDWALTGEVLDDGGMVRGVGFRFVVGDTRIKNWGLEDDPRIVGYFAFDWAVERRGIAEVDMKDLSILTDDYAQRGVLSGKRYHVYNMLCELDSPGEFYFDRENNHLYLYPVEGDTNDAGFSENSVDFSLLSNEMIKINGTSNVNFKNIIFESSLAKGITVGNTATDINIIGCTFKNMASGAELGGYNNSIVSCDFYNITGLPIKAMGGDRVTLTPSGNIVANNKFWNFNTVSRTNTGAIQTTGCGDTISHNEIADSPHTALSMGGNDNIIEYNEFYNCLADGAGDAGVIYNGRNLSVQGNVIRNNYFHDIATKSIGVVYFDDGMSGNTVDSNVFEDTGTGVFVHGGVATDTVNNLFLGGTGSGVGFSSVDYSWKMDTATSISANTFLWNLKQFPYESEAWQKYERVLKHLESDEQPITMYDNTITGNVFVDKAVANIPEKDEPYITVENNTEISGENAAEYEIPQKYAEIMEKAGVYTDEYRTEFDCLNGFDLVRPYNKSTQIEASEVSFEWEKVANAKGYQFTLSTDYEFKDIISNKIIPDNYVTLQKLNYHNTRYYWKVKAIAKETNSVIGKNEIACNQDFYSFTTKAFEVVSKEKLYEMIELCENTMQGIVESEEPGAYKIGTLSQMSDMINKNKTLAANDNLTQKEINKMTKELQESFEVLTYNKNPEELDLAYMIKTPSMWNFTPNQVIFSESKFAFTNLGANTMGTTEKIEPHKTYKFKAKTDDLTSGWIGFGIRAQASPIAVAWGGNSQYVFIIKGDKIEFQRFAGTNFIETYPNECIKAGEWNEYEISAENQDDGSVRLILKVDGNVIVDYTDSDNPITTQGFFEIYNSATNTTIELAPITE